MSALADAILNEPALRVVAVGQELIINVVAAPQWSRSAEAFLEEGGPARQWSNAMGRPGSTRLLRSASSSLHGLTARCETENTAS